MRHLISEKEIVVNVFFFISKIIYYHEYKGYSNPLQLVKSNVPVNLTQLV